MKTTYSRTFTAVSVILLLSLTVLGASLRALVKDYLSRSAIGLLQNDAKVISELTEAYLRSDFPGFSQSNMQFLVNLDIASRVSDADAVICSQEGKILLCSDSPLSCEHQGMVVSSDYLSRVFAGDGISDTGIIQGLYSEPRYIVSLPVRSAGGEAVAMVMVSMPTSATEEALSQITGFFLFVAVLVILLALSAMGIFTRRQSYPLKEMARAASAFGHGDLTARVNIPDSCPDDVEELALAFNNMASSLQKSEYQRQEFVANVSHELKTPMTTIGGYVDGILDGTIPPEKQRHYMRLVSDETRRLSRLVRSMLDISRLQDQQKIPEEKKSRFDLEECAGRVLITFEQKINDKGVNVEVDMPPHPVYTFANPDYITQVIYNLLDNAVKFCPQGKTLGLRIRTGSSKVYVSIFNDGETIPQSELPLVFDRFHKIDKSRSQNRDGWGLGLYIVKTIVCSHGEDISVSSANGHTEFTFTMPLVT